MTENSDNFRFANFQYSLGVLCKNVKSREIHEKETTNNPNFRFARFTDFLASGLRELRRVSSAVPFVYKCSSANIDSSSTENRRLRHTQFLSSRSQHRLSGESFHNVKSLF